jgi:putative sigma-54 modulation protein
MNIDYTGRHMEVTPALKAHVEEHFKKLDSLFDGKSPKVHVVIEVERGLHRSEIVMNWRSDVLTAETLADDMYQSLTQTVSKIEKQARRLKDKVIDKSHRAQKASTLLPDKDVL